MNHEVVISRIHKSSPYNCVAYLEVENEKIEDVINMPVVLNELYMVTGNKIVVTVHSENSTSFLQYNLLIKRRNKRIVEIESVESF